MWDCKREQTLKIDMMDIALYHKGCKVVTEMVAYSGSPASSSEASTGRIWYFGSGALGARNGQ